MASWLEQEIVCNSSSIVYVLSINRGYVSMIAGSSDVATALTVASTADRFANHEDCKTMTFGRAATRCIIGVNGQEIAATAILLYPEAPVREYQALTANARAVLGYSGSGVGVGFIGDAEWALGGAVALGILGAMTANSRTKKARALLKQAEKRRAEVIAGATYVDTRAITNIHLPEPHSWIGEVEGQAEVKMGDVDFFRRSKFLRDQGLSKDDVKGGRVTIAATNRLVSFENEFVSIQTADGEQAIRWGQVASYRLAA